MTQLILWVIIAYGLSNIVVYGSIFNGPRNKINKWAENKLMTLNGIWVFISDMIKCMMCFGFHCGWILSIAIYSPTYQILEASPWISWFYDACLASGAVWSINSVIEWFEENRPSNK